MQETQQQNAYGFYGELATATLISLIPYATLGAVGLFASVRGKIARQKAAQAQWKQRVQSAVGYVEELQIAVNMVEAEEQKKRQQEEERKKPFGIVSNCRCSQRPQYKPTLHNFETESDEDLEEMAREENWLEKKRIAERKSKFIVHHTIKGTEAGKTPQEARQQAIALYETLQDDFAQIES